MRPKIGVVLSGGGAKGFAHVPTLKLIDSLQIPVDYIVGTSMGGIIGGLYSIGYTGLELEKLSLRDDWQEIFTDQPERALLPYFQKKETGKYQVEFGIDGFKPVPPTGLIYGQKISLLFSSLTFPYERITDFDNLPIPYRAIAVDLITGNEVVLEEGSLAKALRATMAIPTIFSPVEMGDSLLIDGGILNNLPVDVAKEMGSEIIIAVDLGYQKVDREELDNALEILELSLAMVNLEKRRANLKEADILIQPDMSDYTVADFNNNKIMGILTEGERAAKKAEAQLVALKDRYELLQVVNNKNINHERNSWRVYGIQIMGNTSVPFQQIYNALDVKVDEPFQPALFANNIAELKTSDLFEEVNYKLIPVSEEYVEIRVEVKEIQNPVIYGINVSGNETLPFTFIYRLLGYQPGVRLDINELNRRLMEMYGLGYFERLWYDIVPISKNRVELNIRMDELPLRKLRVGLRYDDEYRLVGVVSAQATNILIPGIRFEGELQFAGLNKFRYRAYYPSRALNFPIYPYLQYTYRNIPVVEYDEKSTKLATYGDRAHSFSAGLGLIFGKAFNLELGYQAENLNIQPEIALDDPTIFPSFDDHLRKLQASLNFDILDNVLLPRQGFVVDGQYTQSLERFGSELTYNTLNISGNFYRTLKRKHTLRFYGFYGRSSPETPIFKYSRKGGPETFVGVNYNQLNASKLNILRFDYRYEYKKDIFFKLIFNTAFDVIFAVGEEKFNFNDIYGFGIGVKLLSPIGPIEFIVSNGDKNFIGKHKWRPVTYFTMGYKF